MSEVPEGRGGGDTPLGKSDCHNLLREAQHDEQQMQYGAQYAKEAHDDRPICERIYCYFMIKDVQGFRGYETRDDVIVGTSD